MFKNELKTRQKTIENIRFDYIKNTKDSDTKYVDDARDLGFYKIQRYSGGPAFYPINPPAGQTRKENISPNAKLQHAKTLISKTQTVSQV